MKTLRRYMLLLSATALLALAPSAGADTRWASPAGSGVICSELVPCSLVEAITAAPTDSDIVIKSGVYGSADAPISTSLQPGAGADIRGESGASKPVIYSSGNWSFWLNASSSRSAHLSDIELRKVGGDFGAIVYGVIDRVVSIASGAAWSACSVHGTLRNSVCVGHDGASAIMTAIGGSGQTGPDLNIFNVTAIATGSGYAFYPSIDNYVVTFNIRNSIFRATGDDIHADASTNANLSLKIDHSNYGEIVEDLSGGASVTTDPTSAATNQLSQLPQFADAGADDYRQLDTSPTVDAGADNADNGTLDLFGAARIQGARTDIGAHESAYDTTPAVDPVAPTLKNFKFKPSKFKSAKRGKTWQAAKNWKKPKRGKLAVGAVMSFSSDLSGTFVLKIERVTKGRKSGKRCVRQTKKNKSRKRCTIKKQLKGTYTVPVVAGTNKFFFNGRWNNATLPTGSYHVTPTLCAGTPPLPTPGPSSGSGGTNTGSPSTGGSTLPSSNGDSPGTAGGGASSICKTSKGPIGTSTVVVK